MKRTVRVAGAQFLHYYAPRPAPAPRWKRAAWTLADHLVWTAVRGALVLVLGEVLLPLRGVL